MLVSAPFRAATSLAVAALGCLAPACASRAVELEQYCDRYTALACDAAARCGCLDGIPVGTCRAFLRPECESDVEEPVRDGRRYGRCQRV